MLFPLYLGIHIPSCLFFHNKSYYYLVYKAKPYHAFGDAYTVSSQLSAKQVLFLPCALKETAYPGYGFQEWSHNILKLCTIIMTSLSVSLSSEQLYFSCISCTVIRSKSLNVADTVLKKISENLVPAKVPCTHWRSFGKAAGEEEFSLKACCGG